MPVAVKITVFFLAWLLLWLPIAIPLGIVLKWNPFREGTSAPQKLPLVASLYLLAPGILWEAAILEDQSFSVYGFVWDVDTLQSLGWGWLLGGAGLVVMFLGQWRLGWLQFRSPVTALETSAEDAASGLVLSSGSIVRVSLLTLVLAFWISVTEELVFRGFLLNQLYQGYEPLWAATIASLIFALLHLVWEGQENGPQLPGLWLMGMVLALARWVDGGSLGLACGLHAGWVWVIASLDTVPMLSYTGKAPEWITGIAGKPLAGLVGLLFLLATALGLWVLHF